MKPNYFARTIDPEVEPVSLVEAKAQVRMDFDYDDAYLTALITAAREWVEERTHRALLSQTWEVGFESWPDQCAAEFDAFELPRGNVLSVVSVKYRDSAGDEQTVDDDNYTLLGDTVEFADDFAVPSLYASTRTPVKVVFTAGYGTESDSVPAKVRQAILLMISNLYENRSPVMAGSKGTVVVNLPLSVETLIESLTIRNA